MRAGFIALAALAGLAASASAAESGRVDLARLCERAAREPRLESVSGARAEVDCAVTAEGALIACAVTSAAPDNSSVRYFALGQMCHGRRADMALARMAPGGERAATFAFEFNVECTRSRSMQVCAASRMRARQLGAVFAGEAGAGQ